MDDEEKRPSSPFSSPSPSPDAPTDLLPSTHRGLHSRHAQMIALGGTIGTGLFVSTGQGLSMGGPASLLIAYTTLALLMYGIATATGEISAYLPVPGCTMSYYGTRFVSPSLGFTLGWVYWYVFSITVAAEITAAYIVIEYWMPPLHIAVWLTIIGAVIILLNFGPVKYYGEFEFWFASVKVLGILGLLLLTAILFFGGGPTREPLWFSNWHNPSPFNAYLVDGPTGKLSGFLATICFSVYAFAFAPELLVSTAGEMQSPRRNVPKATIRYFYRLVTFYVLGALGISIIVSSKNPGLLTGTTTAGASPWALGIKAAGIHSLDHVINAVVLLSAWSAGNSYLYMASRVLYSLAVAGNAPRIFLRCSKSGVPYYAVLASAAWSLLAYLNCAATGAAVFNWFANIINTSSFISWICCVIIYYRFRAAVAAQSLTGDLPFRSRLQPYAATVSLVGFAMLLILNGFSVFVHGHWKTATFITSYLGVFIFVVLYIVHRGTLGRRDPWVWRAEEVDLRSGLAEVIAAEVPAPKPEKWWEKWKAVFE